MRRYVIASLALVAVAIASVVTAGTEKGPIVPKEKIVLWNGRNFTGWKLFVPVDPDFAYEVKVADDDTLWSIKDGVIHCKGEPAGYIRTEADYANYLLHVEWRWIKKGGNSGILLHASPPDRVWPKNLECQLWSGNAGDFILVDGVRIEQYDKNSKRVGPPLVSPTIEKLKKSSEKPIGQWNTCDIICKDNWAVVFVNGVLQNVATKATVTSGKICLQSEGQVIEFRNIYIEPLE